MIFWVRVIKINLLGTINLLGKKVSRFNAFRGVVLVKTIS